MADQSGSKRWQPWSAIGLAALFMVSACATSEPNDPARERLDRVEARFASSFSQRQVECLVDRLDPGIIDTLDKSADLSPSDEQLGAYTLVLTLCVNNPNGTATTTTTGEVGG